MSRFSLRTRLTILVTVAAAITLAVLTAGFNLLLRSNLDADANRVLQARASAALEGICVQERRPCSVEGEPRSCRPRHPGLGLQRRHAPSSARPARPPIQRLADSLAGGPKAHAEDPTSDIRLFAVPIVQGSDRVGTVVSAISLEPYEHSASKALGASLLYAAAALLLVVMATRLVVTRALRPVAQMTAEAADWSEHDLDHRFNVGEPHDELTQLAATFDNMLARSGLEPAPRAAALGRALPRAPDAAGRDRDRGRAGASPPPWRRRVPRGPSGDRVPRISDAEHSRDADGCGPGRVARGPRDGAGVRRSASGRSRPARASPRDCRHRPESELRPPTRSGSTSTPTPLSASSSR